VLDENDVRPRNPNASARALSGGNQQKLVFGREMQDEPRFIVACQPTRGVDIGAARFIHEQLVHHRDRGAGVLLISSELEEVLALSDRVLVFYSGRIVAEYGRHQVSEAELGLKMGGA
jgi:simple sugar transport system ATP-binding protein